MDSNQIDNLIESLSRKVTEAFIHRLSLIAEECGESIDFDIDMVVIQMPVNYKTETHTRRVISMPIVVKGVNNQAPEPDKMAIYLMGSNLIQIASGINLRNRSSQEIAMNAIYHLN